MLKVSGGDARALLTALDFKGVEKWSDSKVQDKIEALADLKEDGEIDDAALKGKQGKLFQSILDAIEDETEIDVAPVETDEDEPDDDDDDSGADEEDEDDSEEDDDEGDEDDDDSDVQEVDEEDDEDEEPVAAPAKKPAAKSGPEEFVGTRELIAKLNQVCSLLMLILEKQLAGTQTVAQLKAAIDGKPLKPAKDGKGKDDSLKAVIFGIRNYIAGADSAAGAVSEKEILGKLQEQFPTWEPDQLKKRIKVQVESRMAADGIAIKKTKAGKYWVAEAEDDE